MGEITEAVFKSDIDYLRNNLNNSNVNELDEDGRTPLIHACIDKQTDIAELLIANGADVKVVDNENWTALHYAVQENCAEIVELLLRNNATVDIEDENGNTPLWRAVFDYNGDKKVIQTLLKYGANKQHKNKHDVSIVELVDESEDLKNIF